MQLAVFLPNWIGDVVMATPTLRLLRRHVGPDGRLIGIMRPYVQEVLAGTSWLDQTILFDPRSSEAKLRSWSVVGQLRAQRVDGVVMLTNSLRSAVISWLSGAKRRTGYACNGRGLLLTDRLTMPRRGRRRVPTPAIDTYLRLARTLTGGDEPWGLELATLPADEEAADRVWAKHHLPTGEQVVVLNSGGAYGAAKHWPAGYFAELARRIASELRLAVLVVCGPNERRLATEITSLADHPRVVSLAEEPVSIGLTKACIRRSRMLVSTDSGPRFFGLAFGVPVVSLFGPTDIEWTRTENPLELCLQHKVPCGPCMQRECPLGHHQCMRDLTVQQVYQAVTRHLQSDRHAA